MLPLSVSPPNLESFMTTVNSSLEVHDFRQPRQLMPTSWRAMQRWYADACRLVAERWGRLGLDVTLTHHQTRVLSVRSALALVPEPGWGVRATFGAQSIDSLLVGRPGLLKTMANQLLGDTPAQAADSQLLTAVEESMAELLFSEFVQAVGEAWPGAESLSGRLHDTVLQPQRTRMYPPGTTLVVTALRVRAVTSESSAAESPEEVSEAQPAAASEIIWIMPQEEIEDLLEIECSSPTPQLAKPHPAIPDLMREMPVSLTVELGRTVLSMSELTSLETGDVVILEQSVNRPLNVCVGSTVKFRGRPGRIGTRRCLEIEYVMEDTPGARPKAPPNE